MKNTKIEWAHHTVNFWWGCMKVSLACQYCYAELLAKLFSRGKATWGATGARWLRHQRAAEELMQLDASARKRGVRERVFVNSMSDTFEDREDLSAARDLLWICACCVPALDLLLLTKRPENVMRLVPVEWREHWPANVWIGTTVENQAAADERIPHLLQVPARVRFLSCEPLLGPVKLGALRASQLGVYGASRPYIDWVICGGESGPHARPMHPAWAESLRDQCAAARVPFFFKQWGEWTVCRRDLPEARTVTMWADGRVMTMTEWFDHCAKNGPEGGRDTSWSAAAMTRIGKKLAGRLLDGINHNDVPGGAA